MFAGISILNISSQLTFHMTGYKIDSWTPSEVTRSIRYSLTITKWGGTCRHTFKYSTSNIAKRICDLVKWGPVYVSWNNYIASLLYCFIKHKVFLLVYPNLVLISFPRRYCLYHCVIIHIAILGIKDWVLKRSLCFFILGSISSGLAPRLALVYFHFRR